MTSKMVTSGRSTFQVQECRVLRTPKYKEERGPSNWDLAEMSTSVMRISIAWRSHLQQQERSRRHQNRVTRSLQDQIRKLRNSVKDGPFRKHTAGSSNAKSSPKMKYTTKEAPHRKYYMPSNDTKTFQINSKGHLQCHQDPNLIHKPNDKGKLSGSREAPIYHKPGQCYARPWRIWRNYTPTLLTDSAVWKEPYNIRVDPTVKPATHARRKVPIESKEAIDKDWTYLIEEETSRSK